MSKIYLAKARMNRHAAVNRLITVVRVTRRRRRQKPAVALFSRKRA